MTDTQFWILALIGTVTCVLLALLLKREMPSAAAAPGIPAPASQATAPHSHHIYAVHREEGGSITETELRNGMLDPANHAEVSRYLSSGPDHGIHWHDGRVEWGTVKEPPKIDPAE